MNKHKGHVEEEKDLIDFVIEQPKKYFRLVSLDEVRPHGHYTIQSCYVDPTNFEFERGSGIEELKEDGLCNAHYFIHPDSPCFDISGNELLESLGIEIQSDENGNRTLVIRVKDSGKVMPVESPFYKMEGECEYHGRKVFKTTVIREYRQSKASITASEIDRLRNVVFSAYKKDDDMGMKSSHFLEEMVDRTEDILERE